MIARVKFLWTLIRAQHWWNYKLPLAAMVLFMTGASLHLPADKLAQPFVLLMFGGIASAIFASVLNDVTDLNEDILAGKTTPAMALTQPKRTALLAVALTVATAVGFALSFDATVLRLYLLILSCFAAYSLPPLRLKRRGFFGAVCIAAGEHMLPAILAMCLLSATTDCIISSVWCTLVTTWALCFGLRGIIWHQLSDAVADRRNRCDTFAVAAGESFVRRLGERVVFPLETLCFATLLWLTHQPLLWLFLVPYAISDFIHFRYFKSMPLIVVPQQYGRFVWFDFYRLFCPIGLFLLSGLSDPNYLGFCAVYAILFVGPISLLLGNLAHVVRHRTLPFATRKLDRRPVTLQKFSALVEEDVPSVP